ncbi:hypothetical protein TcG_13493, partial [Trypanosoma cruzi]
MIPMEGRAGEGESHDGRINVLFRSPVTHMDACKCIHVSDSLRLSGRAGMKLFARVLLRLPNCMKSRIQWKNLFFICGLCIFVFCFFECEKKRKEEEGDDNSSSSSSCDDDDGECPCGGGWTVRD